VRDAADSEDVAAIMRRDDLAFEGYVEGNVLLENRTAESLRGTAAASHHQRRKPCPPISSETVEYLTPENASATRS
jgi:hypothetical protein